jgi:AcrR family transcriptional regulator
MSAPSKKSPTGPPFIWDRLEPKNRPAPNPLSRESIVRAAIELADKDGLASVSLRKVGASLEAGPMRLYGYLSTKEELLDLMVDMVYGEMLSAGPARGDWRDVLRSIAQRIRQAARKHPWVVDLLGGRPHFGPNALAYREEAFGALSDSPGFEDIDVAMQVLKVVNAYVIGAILSEASELRSERESGLGEAEWQAASWPYIERMIATGRFPMLAKIVRDATHKPSDVEFDDGLECVLDGIAARFQH